MKRNPVIHFAYDGYYTSIGEDVLWISNVEDEEVYSLLLKKSKNEVTYAKLIEKICRKRNVDEASTKLKVSYFPFSFQGHKVRPNYIRDDEDVECYFEGVSEEGFRSVLHVEVINDVELNLRMDENEQFDQVLREDLENHRNNIQLWWRMRIEI
ncbi:unnamed protein product [Arabidopsis thaliana]|uniref:(thale cress) hypothetical protein n=1 Tax=Arabidopsis thaliana TaxID=3702 RepID=A0A7G2E983_ARATH|nr:unnamed protein product [Arabidopsis thaliana]